MHEHELVIDLCKLLRHSHDLLRLILRIKKVAATVSDWQRLYAALEASLNICRLIQLFCSDSYKTRSDKEILMTIFKDVNFQVSFTDDLCYEDSYLILNLSMSFS